MRVAGGEAALREAGEHEGAGAELHAAGLGVAEGDPVVVFDEVGLHPGSAEVGRGDASEVAEGGGLVERHGDTGVADDVVVVGEGVGVGVVLVDVATVGVLGNLDPLGGGGSGGRKGLGRDLRAVLRSGNGHPQQGEADGTDSDGCAGGDDHAGLGSAWKLSLWPRTGQSSKATSWPMLPMVT